ELVTQTFRLVHPEATEHRVALICDPPPLPPALANRVQIAQVMVNLMRNAIQAIAQTQPKTRQITVTTRIADSDLLVQVEDTGGGVDTSIDLFAQFETSKPDGMGLGLSFSRSIVESNGGRLWLDDHKTPSSRFCFTLPIAPEVPNA
ncbi:ATP-binding protein, partial [Amylibacter marinus]|uniref:ATP-binding protein n=1 Tax=Amylibacter marinus TaxID=1475483 RepID=UPI0024E109EE